MTKVLNQPRGSEITVSENCLFEVLQATEITSADYTNLRALWHGEIGSFLGRKIKVI